MKTKKCIICKSYKYKDNYYASNKSYCIPCCKKWRKNNYKENKQHTYETVRKWINNNKEKHAQYCKNWRDNNPLKWKKLMKKNKVINNMYFLMRYYAKQDGLWK